MKAKRVIRKEEGFEAEADNSYIPLLVDYLKKNNPKVILEFGSGLSTEILWALCPHAEIYTVEHSFLWYIRQKIRFYGRDRIHLIYEPNKRKYPKIGWKYKPELIFIDGIERVECLRRASNSNSDVLLHDSQRKEYLKGVVNFKIIEEKLSTMLLKPKKSN